MILALVRGPIGRLILLGLILFALQVSVFTQIRPFGVVMQVMLAFAAAAGVVGGADRGMIVGFIMGLMFDLGTGGPLGASALTFGFGALVASRITSILIEREWWLSAIFVALGAAAGEAAVPVLRALIGDPVILGINTLTNVVVVGVAAGVMSPVLVPLASWALRISATPMRVPAAIE